jgi:hypothetical protein
MLPWDHAQLSPRARLLPGGVPRAGLLPGAIPVRHCDSSITCKLGILFVSVKYVLVSVKLVCVYVKLLKI